MCLTRCVFMVTLKNHHPIVWVFKNSSGRMLDAVCWVPR